MINTVRTTVNVVKRRPDRAETPPYSSALGAVLVCEDGKRAFQVVPGSNNDN